MKLLGQAMQKLGLLPELKNTKIALKVEGQVKWHQLSTTSSVHHETYYYQVTLISEE